MSLFVILLVKNIPGMLRHIAPKLLCLFVALLPSPTLPTDGVGEGKRRRKHHGGYLFDAFVVSHCTHTGVRDFIRSLAVRVV